MASDFDQFKNGFFDRAAVKEALGQAVAAGMAKGGRYIQKTARNSMKKKRGASPPGKPPNVHVGTLKKLLTFAFDSSTQTMVIGPYGLGKAKVPGVLEFGGGNIEKRPYMRPARDKVPPHMMQAIKFGR